MDLFGWGEAVAGIANAVGNVAAAHEQAGAARDAAKMSSDAATHAADVQSQSSAAALEFERQQAEAEAAAHEVDRQGNYNQWAAHERGVSSIGELLGLGGKEIPAYVPGVKPTFAAAPAPGGPAVPAPMIARPGVQVPTVGEIVRPPAASGMPMPGPDDLAALRARMGGNTGVFNPYAPKLQPDGTYAMPGAPVRSIDDYLRA